MRKELQIFSRDIAHQCAKVYSQIEIERTLPALSMVTGLVLHHEEPVVNPKDHIYMDEQWLKDVIGMRYMSDAALLCLDKYLQQNGKLSLENACEWLSLERFADEQGNSKPVFFTGRPSADPVECIHQAVCTRLGLQQAQPDSGTNLLYLPRKTYF